MRTTFDQANILYSVLKNAPIAATLSGGIYKVKRPDNSNKEDVVIGSLPISAGDVIQRGTSIINIHVPDLEITINGVTQIQPNTMRLGELTALAEQAIEKYFGAEYNYWMSDQALLEDKEGMNNHFVSFKVQFKFDNTPVS